MSSFPSKPAVLLVDGYNIIGYCPRLQMLRDRDSMSTARDQLIEMMANYSAFYDHETELVFDAHYQDRPSLRETITQNLTLCYTQFGQNADSYIERSCALFFREDLRRFEKRMIVATSDRAQWLTAVGYGAEWMSAEKLLVDARQAQAQEKKHRQTQKKSSSRFLANSLDSSIQQKLARLRSELFRDGS
jgi:uncharacterized protein